MCLLDALSTSDKTGCYAARTMQTLFSSQRELLPSSARVPARDEKQKARFSRAIKYASTLLLSFFLFNSLSFLVDLAKERKWRGRRASAGETFYIEITRRGGATFVAVVEADNAHVFSHPTQLCLARATEEGE